MNLRNKLFAGDCEEVLAKFPDDCIDLIVTSPPYANQRSHTYGGVSPDKYSKWFLPKSKQLLRVLKPTGTFILNIKERVKNGERLTYVIELILDLKNQGWLWTEEFIWAKTTSMPGWWPNRFRDGWERLLQFNKQKKFEMYQKAVMVPPKESTIKRIENMGDSDLTRRENATQSGFGINVSSFENRKKVYPDNVLRLSPETQNKNHSAVYPLSLPSWFIKLFTKPGGIVLDPFIGSGTTAVAAKQLGRHYVGIDQKSEYIEIAEKRIEDETKC